MVDRIDRIDGLTGSIAAKAPVKVATTEDIVLAGAQTIDGVALTADETPRQRVLVKNQTDATENGIYDVESGGWSRSPDFNGSRDAVDGTQVFVNEGLTKYYLSATNPVSIGTDELVFNILLSATGTVDSVNGEIGSVLLTQDDIEDGETYVQTHNDFTDAEKTLLGNTSGENTGDQVIPTVSDDAYDATSWDGNTDAASKNSIRDAIESLPGTHDAVTIGTANGLSLSGQELSLSAATNLADGAATAAQITAIEANTANSTHTGEVTGGAELTIADNVVDEANLKISNSPTDDYVLTADSAQTGGLKWAETISVGTFYIDVSDYLTNTDGTVDQSTEFESALSAATGGTLYIPEYAQIYLASDVDIPVLTRILGEAKKDIDPYSSTSSIIMDSTVSLTMLRRSTFEKVMIIGKDIFDVSAAGDSSTYYPETYFGGVGILLGNRDCTILDSGIYGFTTGVQSSSTASLTGRLLMENVSMDNTNCVAMDEGHTASKFLNTMCWPYCNEGGSGDTLQRAGTAYNLSNDEEYTQIKFSGCYGYDYGIYLDEAGHGIIITDFYAGGQTSGTGIYVSGTNIEELKIDKFTASALNKGVVFANTRTSGRALSKVTNSTLITHNVGVQLSSDCDAVITGNSFISASTTNVAGVHINTLTSNVSIMNNLFMNNTGSTYQAVLAGTSYTGERVYGPNMYVNCTSQGQGADGTTGSGTVTSVAAGNGMDFTTITESGTATLGTPTTLTSSTTNAVSTTGHTHAVTGLHTSGSDTSLGAQSESLDMNNHSVVDVLTIGFQNDGIIAVDDTDDFLAFRFDTTNKLQMYQAVLYPTTSNEMSLGTSSYLFKDAYATAYYDNGGGYNDHLDDMLILTEMSPLKDDDGVEILDEHGNMLLDVYSLPDHHTNYKSVAEEIQDKFGDLTRAEIRNILRDDKFPYKLTRNRGNFNDNTAGAVRQVDIELRELIDVQARKITKQDQEITELTEIVNSLVETQKIR